MTPRPLAEREEELLGQELVLSKMDAAREQLHTAIHLFFEGGSHVSQHTLIAAAHGVLRDVGASRGLKVSFKDSTLIADCERGAYLKAVHGPQNFFKHANNDPETRFAFKYKLNPLLILDAVFLWISLGEDPTHIMKVFLVWAQLEFPDLICLPSAEEELRSVRSSATTSENFVHIARKLLESAA